MKKHEQRCALARRLVPASRLEAPAAPDRLSLVVVRRGFAFGKCSQRPSIRMHTRLAKTGTTHIVFQSCQSVHDRVLLSPFHPGTWSPPTPLATPRTNLMLIRRAVSRT